MNEYWISMQAACARLNCHRTTVEKYVRLGKIRKWQTIPGGGGRGKRGSKPYFHAGDVESLLPPQDGSHVVNGGAGRNHFRGVPKHSPA